MNVCISLIDLFLYIWPAACIRDTLDATVKSELEIVTSERGLHASLTDAKFEFCELAAAELRGYVKWFSEWWPQNPHPVPCPKAPMSPKRCARLLFGCDDAHMGVGKRGASYWAALVLLACLTWLALILGTSYGTKASAGYTNLRTSTKTAFIGIVTCLICCSWAGNHARYLFSTNPAEILSFVCAYLLMISCGIGVFRCVGVEFGLPTLYRTSFLQMFSVLRILICVVCHITIDIFITALIQWAGPRWLPILRQSSLSPIGQAYYFMVVAYTPWNFGMFLWICVSARYTGYTFYFWGDTTGSAFAPFFTISFPMYFMQLIFDVLSCFTFYARDRQIVAAIGYLLTLSLVLVRAERSYLVHNLGKEGLLITLMLIAIATSVVLMRYQRVLPSQLQKASYIRLSYLRGVLCEEETIKRYQELPKAAFGNPAKAEHLIIISHRWLDRHTCDVTTDLYPQGLRLTTMCQRLERLFPWDWPAFSTMRARPLALLQSARQSALYGSHDILLFFDFMALPQIGILADGTILDRSADEQQLFQEVLPAMGGLYMMFPVLVCREVPEGMPPYDLSGWCSCEYELASLYNKIIDEDDTCIDRESATSTAFCFEATTVEGRLKEHSNRHSLFLKTKNFHFETDRDVVRSIVRGSLTRRLLMQAVQEQDIENVQWLLKQLSDYGLGGTIDFAVDHESLDTLLHIAMRLDSRPIVKALITAGASMECINYRGDTPDEAFGIPRAWFTF